MISDVKYKDINQVMKAVRRQIIDSVPYCRKNFDGFRDPEELFTFLKNATTFVSDPDQVELIHESKSLFENNEHGIVGGGDCDDFTVTATACFIVNEFTPCFICLTGNSKVAPTHIYNMVDYNGKRLVFDLTEPFIDMERPYKYKQILPIKFFH